MRRRSFYKPRTYELARFTAHLALMLEAGMPPLQTLQCLSAQRFSKQLTQAIQKIAAAIEDGEPISMGMRRSPSIFTTLTTSLVASGELAGNLPATLKRLALDLEHSAKLRGEVRNAMIYPSCVIITAAVVSSLLLIFVIPSFKVIFEDLGSQLPWLTRTVITISETFLNLLPAILLCIFTTSITLYYALQTSKGRKRIDLTLLLCPLVGDIIKKTSLVRATRTLSATLNAGVPILLALQVSGEAAHNSIIMGEIERIRCDVAEGFSISHSMRHSTFFPTVLIQMLEVGEKTGALDVMLDQSAKLYEDEVSQKVRTMKQLLEPTMLLILGGTVGILVLAMYLPVFSMGALFN